MTVYIVEYRTWSQSRIEKIFFNKKNAEEYASQQEINKKYNDGYISYYVKPYNVE